MSLGQQPKRRVDPELLFGISLLAGLALAAPALAGALHGNVDITVAGLRLLLAIAFSWAAIYAITTMFTNFSAHADAARQAAERAPHDNGPQRRTTDTPGAIAGSPGGVVDSTVLTPAAITTGPAALGAGDATAR